MCTGGGGPRGRGTSHHTRGTFKSDNIQKAEQPFSAKQAFSYADVPGTFQEHLAQLNACFVEKGCSAFCCFVIFEC